MKSRFDYFIGKIPKSIHDRTRTIIGKNIAVFIPDTYVIHKSMIHDDYHFVIFHTTPPPAIINSREYQLKCGTLLCMSPETEITVGTTKNKLETKYMAIGVKKDFFEEILFKISGNKKIKSVIYDNHYSHRILDFLEIFIQEFTYIDVPSPLVINTIETQIAIQLIRDMGLDPIFNNTNPSQENSYVEQAIMYIESYYNSNITINEICDSIYISPCHFQRIFKNAINKTPYQYILEFRLKKAKEKLKEENVSIAEIARLCGFLNSGHFSTVFKKSEGKTPSEYRNSLKL